MEKLRGLADWVLTREVGGWTVTDALDNVRDRLDRKTVIIALSAGAASLLVFKIWQKKCYFNTLKDMGIPGPQPSLLGGNTMQMFKMGFMSSFCEWEKQFGSVYGLYFVNGPALVVSDPEALRDIFIKKFQCFRNRTVRNASMQKPFDQTLLNLKDDHWKHVRSQLSPAFSSGKLKKMMPAIDRVADNLRKNVGEKARKEEDVELKQLAQCFTMDAIAGAAFGVEVDSLNDPNNPFIVNGRKMMRSNIAILILAFFMHKLFHLLRKLGLPVNYVNMKCVKFFMDFMQSALRERRLENKSYGDFLQVLVEVQKEGAASLQVDTEIDFTQQLATSSGWNRKGLTDEEVMSNSLVFLFGGYEQNSTVIAFSLFCLAANPDAQAKAQKEIDEKLGKNKVTYETVAELTYLDACVSETIRLFPPGFILERDVAEDCEVGGHKVKKGMQVLIPVWAIHRDPKLWPDPDNFDPERFSPEAKKSHRAYSYIPFGDGPRNCIGMRLAQLEVRIGVATVLQHYDVTLTDKSVYPPVFKKPQLLMVPADGMWVRFKPRS